MYSDLIMRGKRLQRFFERVPRGLRYLAKRNHSNEPMLNGYEHRVYSQNGEDGIIAEIFRRVESPTKFCVEFGVDDGHECNTALLTRRFGWSGVMIEGSPERFSRLQKLYRSFANVRPINAMIDRENIVDLLKGAGVPRKLDLLSIDIDGNDYWVWESIAKVFEARVVVIEYNPSYPPPIRWIMRYNPSHSWNGTTYFGASLASLEALGERLGYAMIGTDRAGVNAFFLRRELLEGSGLPALTAEEAYHQGPILPRLPFATGPFDCN